MLAALVFAAVTALAAGPAWAAPPAREPTAAELQEARTRYKRGVELYEQGAYGAARTELEEAYRLAPTYKLLYNLALVQNRQGDFAGASASLRTFIESGGAEIPAARRAEVEHLLFDLEARVAAIEVSTNVAGADVTVDGQPSGTTPLGSPVRLNPGPHTIAAAKSGFSPAHREIDLTSGQRAKVVLELSEVPAAPAPPGESQPTPPPPAPSPAPPPLATVAPPVPSPEPSPRSAEASRLKIGWGVTAGLGVAAVATGIAALVESKRLTSEINAATPGGTIRSTHDTTVGLALASDILTGVALVGGGTMLYFTLTASK
ncbi:MAG TPA: PEGA domain-containing protein, partial [Polyangiaceae bacterium]